MMSVIPHGGLKLGGGSMLGQNEQMIRGWKGQLAHGTEWLGIGVIPEFLFPHAIGIKVFLVQSTLFSSLALVHPQFLLPIFFFRGYFQG